MRKITYLIACLTLITISISACKKKNDDPTPTKTTEEKFIGTWKTTQVKVTIAGLSATSSKPCLLDDKITFNKDGSYKKTVGELKCDSEDVDMEGRWVINNGEVNSSVTLGDIKISENFKLLDDNTMQHTASLATTTDGKTDTIETVTTLTKE